MIDAAKWEQLAKMQSDIQSLADTLEPESGDQLDPFARGMAAAYRDCAQRLGDPVSSWEEDVVDDEAPVAPRGRTA